MEKIDGYLMSALRRENLKGNSDLTDMYAMAYQVNLDTQLIINRYEP